MRTASWFLGSLLGFAAASAFAAETVAFTVNDAGAMGNRHCLRQRGDQLRMLEHDNLVSETAKAEGRTLDGIGITPTSFEAIVPSYLWRFRRYGQFEKTREA